MSRSENLTTRRFRLLLAHLRDEYVAEHDHDHGWIKAAADKIGRHRSGISAIWAGTKGVGSSTAEKAKTRLGLPTGFFMEEDFDAKGWLAERAGGRMKARPAGPEDDWDAFSVFMERFGAQYSKKTLDALQTGLFHRDGSPGSVGDYVDTAEELERVWAGEAEIAIRPKG